MALVTTPVEKLAYDIHEAAQALGISERLTRRLINDGELPIKRLGRRVVVPRIALERYLNEDSHSL